MSSVLHETESNYDLASERTAIDFQVQPMQLQKAILESPDANYALKVEKPELKESIEVMKNIKFMNKVHFCYGEVVPFCPNCHKIFSLLIRLAGPRQSESGHIYNCPVCKKEY